MDNTEVIQTLKEYLSFIIKETNDICEMLSEENYGAALEKISMFTEKIEILLEAVMALKIEVEIDEINDILNQIVEALENEDYILVSDLFEYEIKPIIDGIKEKIDN